LKGLEDFEGLEDSKGLEGLEDCEGLEDSRGLEALEGLTLSLLVVSMSGVVGSVTATVGERPLWPLWRPLTRTMDKGPPFSSVSAGKGVLRMLVKLVGKVDGNEDDIKDGEKGVSAVGRVNMGRNKRLFDCVDSKLFTDGAG